MTNSDNAVDSRHPPRQLCFLKAFAAATAFFARLWIGHSDVGRQFLVFLLSFGRGFGAAEPMRSLLVFLLINGLGIAAPALANPCQSVSSYDVDRLRTAAIETDLDKFDTALGPFTVRDLRIVRQDVFPQEHHWLARQTNRFHLLTREWVLEAALPFKVGEVVSEPILAEAERVLRDNEIGWSSEAFGAGSDYLLAQGSVSGRWYLTDKQLLSLDLEFSGRYELDEGVTEEAVVTMGATYQWQHRERWSLFVRGSYTLTQNLPDHRQLRLGGDTNLRGYPSRYQIGDRQYLFTIEERYYTDLVPFGMFRVGWAAFVDVGRAWYAGTAPAWVPERKGDHFKMLSNLGLGLRLESIRTRRDRVIHVDIAKPLVDGPEVDSYELVLTVKQTI
ncbi:MAG: hypothetical protein O7F71_11190 [Gammaproteobacteria bacterium]|nr:hypothetical protein [Gammaproteobacteria bacterium]